MPPASPRTKNQLSHCTSRVDLAEVAVSECDSDPSSCQVRRIPQNDLALEDAQLVPEDQQLEPEAGVRASAIDEGIEEQTEDGIEESEKNDRASWQVGSSPGANAGTASEFLDRTGLVGELSVSIGHRHRWRMHDIYKGQHQTGNLYLLTGFNDGRIRASFRNALAERPLNLSEFHHDVHAPTGPYCEVRRERGRYSSGQA
jgi:hypothetical protein